MHKLDAGVGFGGCVGLVAIAVRCLADLAAFAFAGNHGIKGTGLDDFALGTELESGRSQTNRLVIQLEIRCHCRFPLKE